MTKQTNVRPLVKWKGLKPNPSKFFGFIYVIRHHESGKRYLGKKQYWVLNPKRTRKRPITDTSSDQWQPQHWKESDWKRYTGSCAELNQMIAAEGHDAFDFHIIKQVSCLADLTYSETEMLVKREALVRRSQEGERLYLNGNISAIRFIPPNRESEMLDVQ